MSRLQVSAFISRAYAYEKINRIDEAIRDLSQAIIVRPEFKQHYLTRARLYKKLGEIELAVQDYKKGKGFQNSNSITFSEQGSIKS